LTVVVARGDHARNVGQNDTTVGQGQAATKVEGPAVQTSGGCLEANEVAELLEGALSDEARRQAESHIDQCESCRSLVASLATRLSLMLPSSRSESLQVSRYARGWVSTLQSEGRRTERSLAAGDHVDDFRIERLLGRGGMGEVYLAKDTKLGRKVAIKVVSLHLDTGNALEQFMAEARTTAQLNHPHVVTIHRVGEYEGRPYLALEYVRGKSLRQWLGQHAGKALHEGLGLVLAVAEALVAAHRRSILHRDLKPENVLIDDDGRVRVVDFGLAVSFAAAEEMELTDDGELSPGAFFTGIVGTPRYMAPEQWTEADQAAGVDIWALGVILYELVSGGLHPTGPSDHQGDSMLRLAALATSAEPFAPPPTKEDVPEALQALIARCLDKDPAQRPTAQEVVTELSALLAPPEQPAARHSWLTIGGAMAAGAVVVGLAFMLAAKPDANDESVPTPGSGTGAADPPPTAVISSDPVTPPPTASSSSEPETSTSSAPLPSRQPPRPIHVPQGQPTHTAPTATGTPADPLDKW
jgi:serine/threonine protein kinase